MTLYKPAPDKSYFREDLEVFDMLQHPVWVFDIEERCMFWANTAALQLWNAESQEEILKRDFKSDLSDATKQRMEDNLNRLRKGEIFKEQWTLYPKGKATTVNIAGSAIRIGEGGRIAVLAEAELPDAKDFDQTCVRGLEMLRHLPLPVCQYDMEGKLVFQNPASSSVFGMPKEGQDSFLSRFVDRELAKTVLQTVLRGEDYHVETELYTKTGAIWFSVSVRRAKDPITANDTILWSARDFSDIIKARKEKNRASLKSEFYAVIAHEIRTPLHQIIGFMDLLELTQLSRSQAETVKVIQTSTSLLMSIINDLLDWTKLENGKMQLECIGFSLSDWLNGCLAAVELEAERKKLNLCRDFANDLPDRVQGDPNRLRQVILNLLTNAIKFTERGTIRLHVRTMESTSTDPHRRLRFEVTDTGIGIDAGHQEMLFSEYQQGHAAIARNYGGTGLGLAICKSLVKAMRGSIWLTSELDKGTTVFVEVPLVLEEVEEDAPPRRRTSANHRSATSELSPLRLKVLVAEDNKINQKMVRSMLQRMGHTVTIAENGQIAVDEVRQGTFDLVLMDIQMPVLDGFGATKQIRSMVSDLPIVGLTASYQPSEMDYYLSVGMQTCLGKPLRLKDLKQAIDDAIMVDDSSNPALDNRSLSPLGLSGDDSTSAVFAKSA